MDCPKCKTRMVVDVGMTEACPLCGCSEPTWTPNVNVLPRCPRCGSSFLEITGDGQFRCPDCGVSGCLAEYLRPCTRSLQSFQPGAGLDVSTFESGGGQ